MLENLGSTRKVAFPIIHAYIITSFISMEVYLKWTAARTSEGTKLESGDNRSKIVSLVLSSGFVSQFILDKAIPESFKGRQFFIFKVFFNNLVFFIICPAIIIACLGSVRDYSCQFLASKLASFSQTPLVAGQVKMISTWSSCCRSNTVEPKL